MSDSQCSNATNAGQGDLNFRYVLAKTVLWSAIWGLILLGSFIAIASIWAPNKEALDGAQRVFNSLLPVFGTWVGTLLAYYFSKENFESATKSVASMAKSVGGLDRLKSITVASCMIPRSKIQTLPDKYLGQPDSAIPLKELIDGLNESKTNRLPIFNPNGSIRLVAHLSILEKFVSKKALAGGAALGPLMFSDFTADAELNKLVTSSFGIVSETATLADAKTAMDNVGRDLGTLGTCQDVFVTKGGGKSEPVTGWITDDILVDNAKLFTTEG